MATVAPTFREPAVPEKSHEDQKPMGPPTSLPPLRLGTSGGSSLLDFPPGISPSPLPTIEQTPNRFLAACASKLDQEPNPFENTFKQVANGGPIPEPPSGSGFTASPKPILPPPSPSPRFLGFERLDGFPFAKTGFTPGGLLTPISAAIAAITSGTGGMPPEGLAPSSEGDITPSSSGPSPLLPSDPIPTLLPSPYADSHTHYQFPAPVSSIPPSSSALHQFPPHPLYHQHSDPAIYRPVHYTARTASGYPMSHPLGVDPMLTLPMHHHQQHPDVATAAAAAAATSLQLLSHAAASVKPVDLGRRPSIEAQRGGWPPVEDDAQGGDRNGGGGYGGEDDRVNNGVDANGGAVSSSSSSSRKRGRDDDDGGRNAKSGGKFGGGGSNKRATTSSSSSRSRKRTNTNTKNGGSSSASPSKAEADHANGDVGGGANGSSRNGADGEGGDDGSSDNGNGGNTNNNNNHNGGAGMSNNARGGRSRSRAKSANGDDEMDPDEKRRSFLERNRQAALKCRQKKKQWLANLQSKVEFLTNDNENLQSQATALREEILNLKTLLLAHKDCPVALANGLNIATIQAQLAFSAQAAAASALGHQQQQQQQQQQQLQPPTPVSAVVPNPPPNGVVPPGASTSQP